MPKVPTYEAGQVRTRGVGQNQLSTNAPIDAFGGGAAVAGQAKALDNVLGTANKMVVEYQDRANKLRTEEAENEAATKMSSLFSGSEEDGEEGAISKKGKDAIGVAGEYLPKFDQSVKEIASGLSNEVQREAFLRKAQGRRAIFAEQLNRHETAEVEKYEDQTTQAGIAISQDEAIKNYADPVMVGAALTRQRELIQDFAKAKGFSPEQTQAALTKSLSTTHSMIITQMLDSGTSGDTAKAKAYMDVMKGEMTGEDYTKISKAVDAGDLRAESMKTADAIMGKGLSQSQALAETKKIEDPKLREETTRRVRDDYAAKTQAEQADKNQVYQSSFDKIRLSKGNIDAVSPAAMAFMDADQVKALQNYASDQKAGKTAVTDPATYSEIITQSSVPALKDKFLQRDLLVDFGNGKLSMSDFQELTKAQASARKGDSQATSAFATKDEMIKSTLVQAGLPFSYQQDEKKQNEIVGKFHQALNQTAEEYKKMHGKEPTGPELQKLMDNLVQEVEVFDKGIIWDGTESKKRFQVDPTDRVMQVRITDPKKLTTIQKNEIVDQLKSRGIAVTNDNILKYYNRQVGN